AGRLRGEQLHPRSGRVDAEQERLEIEAARAGDDDLGVEDAAGGNLASERLAELREVAGERPLLAALQVWLAAVPEDEAAEAVPFRLVEPVLAGGNVLGQLRQHGVERRTDHRGTLASWNRAQPSSCLLDRVTSTRDRWSGAVPPLHRPRRAPAGRLHPGPARAQGGHLPPGASCGGVGA